EDPPVDPPEVLMADNQTIAELLQAPTEGYEDAIVIPEITANYFELKHDLINLVQNKQFFKHDKEDPHAHIRYFNKITSTMRVLNVPSSSIKLVLFSFSLEGAARIWLEKEPSRSILTWDDLVTKFINQACPYHGFSELHQFDRFYNVLNVNDQDSLNSAAVVAKVSTSSSTPAISSEVSELKDMVRALLLDKKNQSSAPASSSTPAPVKADSLNSAAGRNFLDKMLADCLKIIESKSKFRQTRAKAVVAKVNSSSSTPAISSDVAELKDMVRALLLDKKNQYSAPTPSSTPAPIKAVEPNCVTCGGSGTLPGNTITNPKEDLKGITTRSGVAYQGPTIPTPSKVAKQGTEVSKPVVAPVSAPTPNLKPSIPYLLRRDNETRRDQANEQIEKFYEIFKDMRMDECLALADLGASINLMPLSLWKGLSLPELTPTCMTLEFADHSVSKPIGIAKYVSVKVGVFYFPADFVVVDFKLDPRVPLILERCFLKTGRALIYVHKGELTLRIGNEAITYNLDQTSRYSTNFDQMTANKIDVTGEACEEYSQEVLGFSDVTACEAKTIKSSINEPPEVELKDLPPHLEYAFLKGDNKLPVIIAKELGDEEKSALIKVLKSHKRAIAWKLSDIQGINPEFCIHKILMEEDYKPAVQHQRRVNPKIHDVIKKEMASMH
nr:hypothetical protein [Tanacetum cinerariifolium]